MPLSRSQAAAKGEKVAELPKEMGALDMQLQQRSTPQKGKFPVRTTSEEEETDEFDDLEIDEDGGDSQEHQEGAQEEQRRKHRPLKRFTDPLRPK